MGWPISHWCLGNDRPGLGRRTAGLHPGEQQADEGAVRPVHPGRACAGGRGSLVGCAPTGSPGPPSWLDPQNSPPLYPPRPLVQHLARLKHPSVVRLVAPLEETRTQLVFITGEHIDE